MLITLVVVVVVVVIIIHCYNDDDHLVSDLKSMNFESLFILLFFEFLQNRFIIINGVRRRGRDFEIFIALIQMTMLRGLTLDCNNVLWFEGKLFRKKFTAFFRQNCNSLGIT